MSMIQVRVAKLNTVLDFEIEALPATSLQYAITYGLTQAINDAHASIARKNFETDSAFLAAVEEKVAKRHEQIASGNVPGFRAPADPNAAKARKLAKEMSDAEMDAALAFIMKQRERAAKAA